MMLNNAGLTANLQPGLLGVHVVLAFQSEVQLWKGQMRLIDTNSEAALKALPSDFASDRRLRRRSLPQLVPTGALLT